MALVEYQHEIPYGYDVNAKQYPRLTLRVTNGVDGQAIDLDAYLDSGAERSLIDGRLAPTIGIDLLTGREFRFQSTAGATLEARLHRVQLVHDLLGSFDLEVGFSTAPVSRSLLGRDFFGLVQVGFRESHLMLYVSAQP